LLAHSALRNQSFYLHLFYFLVFGIPTEKDMTALVRFSHSISSGYTPTPEKPKLFIISFGFSEQ
jgi:hypothetical protein